MQAGKVCGGHSSRGGVFQDGEHARVTERAAYLLGGCVGKDRTHAGGRGEGRRGHGGVTGVNAASSDVVSDEISAMLSAGWPAADREAIWGDDGVECLNAHIRNCRRREAADLGRRQIGWIDRRKDCAAEAVELRRGKSPDLCGGQRRKLRRRERVELLW